MQISVPVHRIRQFLFHMRSYGLRSALRSTWLFFKVRMNFSTRQTETRSYGGMPWAEFENHFLLRRDIYKGVFVQHSMIPWNDSLFQRPQQMALALGRLGYLVIYKTPKPDFDEVIGVRNIAPNVYLVSSVSFDFIEGAVHSFYSTALIPLSNWTKPRNTSFRVIYEYVDHIDPKISGKGEIIKHLLAQRRLAIDENKCDFIVATSRELEKEAVNVVGRDKVLYVPNGVDVWHYRNVLRGYASLPTNLIKFREEYENIVGYFGAIAPWLWYEEIERLVNNRPDLGFVFIGPEYTGNEAGKLPQTDNILWLGKVSYDSLPAYADQFDVCFIPFEPGQIARTTSPLKLFEYFSLGKPVVTTSQMHECTAFDVVFSGSGANSLSVAIDKAIGFKSDRAFKDKLVRLANENSWDNRARSLENVFPRAPTATHGIE